MKSPKTISFHCPVCARLNRTLLERGGRTALCRACTSLVVAPRSTPSTFKEPKVEKARKPLFRGFASGLVWGAVLAVLGVLLVTQTPEPVQKSNPSQRPAAAVGDAVDTIPSEEETR